MLGREWQRIVRVSEVRDGGHLAGGGGRRRQCERSRHGGRHARYERGAVGSRRYIRRGSDVRLPHEAEAAVPRQQGDLAVGWMGEGEGG